jgi:hypothetical protein
MFPLFLFKALACLPSYCSTREYFWVLAVYRLASVYSLAVPQIDL